MECYTKQRYPDSGMHRDMPIAPCSLMRPDMPGSCPPMRPDMPPNCCPPRCDIPGNCCPPRCPEKPPVSCPGPSPCSENINRYPVGMTYVPWQCWQQVYPIERAIARGTIFPDLDKPFMMGRCRGC